MHVIMWKLLYVKLRYKNTQHLGNCNRKSQGNPNGQSSMAGPISKILEKIRKTSLQSNFARQRLDSVDTCKLLTDDDLKELGIATIGDRAALRDAVNRLSEEERAPATQHNDATGRRDIGKFHMWTIINI